MGSQDCSGPRLNIHMSSYLHFITNFIWHCQVTVWHCWNHHPMMFSTAWLILWHNFLQTSLSSSNHSFDVTSLSLLSFVHLHSFGYLFNFFIYETQILLCFMKSSYQLL